ncbi:MAG: hypothetical protein R2789_15750 [Microthrixaceae bacterium]
MAAYLEGVILRRVDEPRDDLISYLAHADIDGMPLTPTTCSGPSRCS